LIAGYSGATSPYNQLLGPSRSRLTKMFDFLGVPASIAGATFGIFEFAERVSSKNAKASLTQAVATFDTDAAASLPRSANELFQTIFGSDHFSRKCFLRSGSISIAGMTFFLAIAAVTQSADSYFWQDVISFYQGWNEPYMIGPELYILMASLWVPIGVLIDYLMLFKTRFVLGLFSSHSFSTTIIVLLCLADLVSGYYIFFIVFGYFQNTLHLGAESPFGILTADIGIYTRVAARMLWPINSVSAFFYAALLPSIWIWIYIGSVVFARAIVHSTGALRRLQWLLDVDLAPFRSVGVVAAALIFVFTLIIVAIERVLQATLTYQ
jgi:hypothetical protein